MTRCYGDRLRGASMCGGIKTKEISSACLGRSFMPHIPWGSLKPPHPPLLNRTFSALTCVWMSDPLCSQVPGRIKTPDGKRGSESLSGTRKEGATFVVRVMRVSLGLHSGCKPRALHWSHRTLPRPSLVSQFITLQYHVSPLANLLLYPARRKVWEHSRWVAREARWGQAPDSPPSAWCVRAARGEVRPTPATDLLQGAENALSPVIRLGVPRRHQAFSLHLRSRSMIASRWPVWNTRADLVLELHIWRTEKGYLKEPLTRGHSVNNSRPELL